MANYVGTIYRSQVPFPAAHADCAVSVKLPDGSRHALTPAGTGQTTYVDYQSATEGLHSFIWTLPVTGYETYTDYMSALLFRSLIGLDETRDYLTSNPSRDPVLIDMLVVITEKIESLVGTCVPRQITKERLPGCDREALRLVRAPIIVDAETAPISIESIWPGGPAWSTEDLVYDEASGVVEPNSLIGFWYGPWQASYTAGRTIIPEAIRMAAKLSIFDLWANQRGVTDDQLEPGLVATAQYENYIPSNYDLPLQAKSLLRPYRMPGFA